MKVVSYFHYPFTSTYLCFQCEPMSASDTALTAHSATNKPYGYISKPPLRILGEVQKGSKVMLRLDFVT